MMADSLDRGFQIMVENGILLLILQTSFILLMVWLWTHFSKKKSAAQRHLWWSLGLTVCLLLPLWHAFGPKILLPVLPESFQAGKNNPPPQFDLPEIGTIATDNARSPVGVGLIKADDRSTGYSANIPLNPEITHPTALNLTTALKWLYLIGAVGLFFQLAFGLIRVALLSKGSTPLRDTSISAIIDEIRHGMRLKRPVTFLVSPKVNMPFTWGFMRPKILLPAAYSTWETAILRNVLIHEMAHVKRGDWLMGITARISMVLHWFNPLSWKALARLRLEAERASDDWVLALGNPAVEYADQLLSFLRAAHPHPIGKNAMVAMASRSDFSERMISILASSERRHSMRIPQVVCMVLFAFGLTGLMAGVNLAPKTEDEPEPKFILGKVLNYRLMDAVQSQNIEKSEALLEAGANVNFKMPGDGTPLIIAAQKRNLRLADMLLQAGANPNLAVGGDGNPLIQAAYRGDLEMARLLLNAGADVNRGVHGDGSPLQVAVHRGHTHLVELFLEANADVNLAVKGDGNALISAAKKGRINLAEMLLDHGADVDGYVKDDETPLIQAVMANRFEMAEFLILNGADVNKAVPHNDMGDLRSPMSAALIRNNEKMIEILKSHGAVEPE